jgi:hypothetical protein
MGLGRSERPIHRMSRLVPAMVRSERAHAVRVITCQVPFLTSNAAFTGCLSSAAVMKHSLGHILQKLLLQRQLYLPGITSILC